MAALEAFFLPATNGARFCVHHRPKAPRGVGVVFVPPFAEETNKSRHVVAEAARGLAQVGIGVLSIDLAGCGDSSGSMSDFRWSDWLADLALASDWLQRQGYSRLWMWGMRLGALLVAEFAVARPGSVERCLLWQPLLSGEAALVQFLRLRSASAMITGQGRDGETVKQLRARLQAGETLDIAGYPLSPGLARDLERLHLESMRPSGKVHWMEVVPEIGRGPSVASARLMQSWHAEGTMLTSTLLEAEPFWAATNPVELVHCPSIVEATIEEALTWVD